MLAEADHVVNVLPENESTKNYVNARPSPLQAGARFDNSRPGRNRGPECPRSPACSRAPSAPPTRTETIPEPPPPSTAMVSAQLLYNTAYGRGPGQLISSLVRHFLANLAAFEKGAQLTDRVL